LVLKKPELFELLMSGIALDDPLVAMRSADAAEKITRDHPEWLTPYKQTLLDKYSCITQAEVRWHVVAMLPRLPLNNAERRQAFNLALNFTQDRSSIVRTMAMQALYELAMGDQKLRRYAHKQIENLCTSGTAAMKARGRKLLEHINRGCCKR